MENPSAKPLIYTVTNPAQQKAALNDLKNNLPKIIFGALILIIAIELFIGLRSLFVAAGPAVPKIQPLGAGRIVVDAPKLQYKMGENIPLQVRIITGGKTTDSTDLVMHYDPETVQSSNASIKTGNAYLDYPIADVDQKLGLIRISGITPPGKEGFNGIGDFATINFRALKPGPSKISVEFEKGATTDSNIVESGAPHDLLTEVISPNIEINQNVSESAPKDAQKTSQKCSGYIQYCQDSKGLAGSQYCTSGSLVNNSCNFDPKLSISCDSCKVR